MSDALKGNYELKSNVKIESDKKKSLEDVFEMEAKKQMGGSIAFVSKRRVVWDLEDE